MDRRRISDIHKLPLFRRESRCKFCSTFMKFSSVFSTISCGRAIYPSIQACTSCLKLLLMVQQRDLPQCTTPSKSLHVFLSNTTRLGAAHSSVTGTKPDEEPNTYFTAAGYQSYNFVTSLGGVADGGCNLSALSINSGDNCSYLIDDHNVR
jgi:hypothetical protein